jgi:hypothetical protein
VTHARERPLSNPTDFNKVNTSSEPRAWSGDKAPELTTSPLDRELRINWSTLLKKFFLTNWTLTVWSVA